MARICQLVFPCHKRVSISANIVQPSIFVWEAKVVASGVSVFRFRILDMIVLSILKGKGGDT